MAYNISNVITLPELRTTSSFLHVVGPNQYGGSSDMEIGFSQWMLSFMARQIIVEELESIAREHPDYDMGKLQTMLDSYDIEMNQLAFKWFEEHTIYCRYLLPALKTNNMYTIEGTIFQYINNNNLNITRKIK